ncbi:class II aldolase/adducin domain-containing protein [Hysterangium stoloniferum]|nr:class II aldolase/adducin domain-containing protein [Hysterangium stoloniferum]
MALDQPAQFSLAREYGSSPVPPTFETKEQERESIKVRLAQMIRIFAHRGYNDSLTGNVTARDPVRPDTYWINPSGVYWISVQPDDLVHVDQQGNRVLDSGSNREFDKDGLLLHAVIHSARPDVMCIAYGQPPHGLAFSRRGQQLDMITQDSCAFYKDNSAYEGETKGEAGRRGILTALGKGRAVFIKNNGFIIAGPSIEGTVSLFISCEKCSHVQSLSDLAAKGREFGPPHQIEDQSAYDTWKIYSTDGGAWPEFQALARRERAV